MTVFGWILTIVGSISVLFFGVRLYTDMKWNQRLGKFHKRNAVKMPKIPNIYWIKRIYGLTLSSFAVVTIVACGAFSLPVRDANIYLSAKTVGTEERLKSLITNYQYSMAEDALGGMPTPEVDFSNDEQDRDYINTNMQVEGVIEADIVKTDGYTIYYATRYQNRVRVINILDSS